MRITNTMLVNNFLRNLNNNMHRVGHIQNQLASGRRFANISDDPVALIYSMNARNSMSRLSHYQRTVSSAHNWLEAVETGTMELQRKLAYVTEQIGNAATDAKTDHDRQNIAALIGQLRNHFVDTLNRSFSDHFVFGGYNTPGEAGIGQDGRILGPFRVHETSGDLYFNSFNLSQFDGIPAEFLHMEISSDWGVAAGQITAIETALGMDLLLDHGVDPEDLFRMHMLKNDVKTFAVAPAVSIPVTMSGIDLVLFSSRTADGEPIVRNIFTTLSDLYTINANPGSTAMQVHEFLRPVQDGQRHILTRTAEIGGRVRRLELLEARFDQDRINYRRMLSDAEDVEYGETIMEWNMAQAIYQATLSAGARIIQPTLMDFLR